MQPAPGIATLLERIAALESEIKILKARKGETGDSGPAGPTGLTGPAGPAGTITVVLVHSKGNQIDKAEGVKKNVVLTIDRFLKEK